MHSTYCQDDIDKFTVMIFSVMLTKQQSSRPRHQTADIIVADCAKKIAIYNG